MIAVLVDDGESTQVATFLATYRQAGSFQANRKVKMSCYKLVSPRGATAGRAGVERYHNRQREQVSFKSFALKGVERAEDVRRPSPLSIDYSLYSVG
jgi:hypothetical protein